MVKSLSELEADLSVAIAALHKATTIEAKARKALTDRLSKLGIGQAAPRGAPYRPGSILDLHMARAEVNRPPKGRPSATFSAPSEYPDQAGGYAVPLPDDPRTDEPLLTTLRVTHNGITDTTERPLVEG